MKINKEFYPLVSIVVNSHNGANYVRGCINSILNQTYNNYEIIFYDNKSDDNTKKIINNFNNKKIKYFYSSKFLKLYNARHKAVKKAKGVLIAFLDIDDRWKKNKLKLQVPFFKDENIGLSCTNYIIDNKFNNTKKKAFQKIPSGDVTNELLKKNFIGMCTLIIRKKAYFELTRGFDPNLEIIGDYDLCLRLSKNWKLISLESPLSIYRWHNENLSNKRSILNFKELIYWYKKNSNFQKFKNYKFLKNFAHFHLSKSYILNYEKIKTFKEIPFLNFVSQIKIIILIIIPTNVLRRIRKIF